MKCPNKFQEDGFTLVEMMIAIALIGVLAAVAVPNFKKYQAKAKTTEAKIQLSMTYTAQTAFYQLFDMYATCLDYMGVDTTETQNKRYYAYGFPNVTADIDEDFYNSAVGERLVSAECPRDLSDTVGQSVFLAGKAVGDNVIDTLAKLQAIATNADNALDEVGGPTSTEVHSGIGNQATQATKAFTIMAAGYIDSSAVEPDEASLWTINQNKKLTNFQTGY